jgi:hypothetical protein
VSLPQGTLVGKDCYVPQQQIVAPSQPLLALWNGIHEMVEEAKGSSPKISLLSQICSTFKMKIMSHPQPIGSQLLTHLSLIISGIPELLIPICPSDSGQTPILSFQNSIVTTRKCLALPAPQQLSDCL